MPNWTIRIVRDEAGKVSFQESPLHALRGDLISWRNEDDTAHWPAELTDDGVPDPQSFMELQIPSGGMSDSAYSPPTSGVCIRYCCVLHPEETGEIEVLSQPPSAGDLT